jgi:hypothetical protein
MNKHIKNLAALVIVSGLALPGTLTMTGLRLHR